MRVTLLLLLLAALFAVNSCQSHDLIVGQVTYGDVVLHKENIHKYGFPFIIRTSVVEYPLPGMHNFAQIRAVYAKDHYIDGSGGYPTISAGGINQKFVKLKLKSQRHHGFNFTVTIYGRY